MNKSKVAIVCETPFHVFNAINFTKNNIMESNNSTDIYIYDTFNGFSTLANSVEKLSIFNAVYRIRPYINGHISALTTLYRLIFPLKCLKKHLHNGSKYSIQNYSHIVFSHNTMRTRNFVALYPEASHVVIEDGLGSYFGNQIKQYVTGFYKLFDKYIFRGKYDCNPIALYLYCPQLCTSTISSNKQQLPKIEDSNPAIKTLMSIFDYRQNTERTPTMLYLTQPPLTFFGDYYDSIENDVLHVLSSINSNADDLLVRVHPRQISNERYSPYISQLNNFWELECYNSISDSNILISPFSTACFSPKLLCNTEPYIIFIYHLLYDTSNVYWRSIDDTIQRFTEIYQSNAKIYTPKTLDEFEKILIKLKDSAI